MKCGQYPKEQDFVIQPEDRQPTSHWLPLRDSQGLLGAGDLLLSTIYCGKDPSTTPLIEGIIGYRFSAFWLRSSVVSVLISLISDTLLIE